MGLATLKRDVKDVGVGIKMHEIPINVLWEDYALTSYEDIYKPPPPGKGLFKAPSGSLRLGGQMNRIHPQSLGPSITPYNGVDGDRPIHFDEITDKVFRKLVEKASSIGSSIGSLKYKSDEDSNTGTSSENENMEVNKTRFDLEDLTI